MLSPDIVKLSGTTTSDDSNVSKDTLILSSDEYEDEKNRIKKRKLDFYKGCPDEDVSFVGIEVESKAMENACHISTDVVEIKVENTTSSVR